jgi:small-conductance mechanosensitive channel
VVIGGMVLGLFVVDRLLARKGRIWVARLPAAEQAVLETRYRLLRRVIMAVLVFVGVSVILFEIEATRDLASTVFASSAVIGLAVGFAARSTLANFVAGIMIALNQPVRLGDRVIIGESEGVVEDIGLTYTRLRTADNRRVLIPNEELAQGRVVNQTLIDPVALAQVRISVPLEAHPTRVRTVLEELVPLAPGRVSERLDPGVTISDLTDTRAVFQVSVWTPDAAQAAQTAAWMRERAVARLYVEGVFRGIEAEVVE